MDVEILEELIEKRGASTAIAIAVNELAEQLKLMRFSGPVLGGR